MATDSNSTDNSADVSDIMDVSGAIIENGTAAMDITKIEDEPEVQGFVREDELEPYFAGELDGDPHPFDPLETEDETPGFFSPSAVEDTYCDYDNGDAECDPIGMRGLFTWVPPHNLGEKVFSKLVIHDADGRFATLRERQSLMEIRQFHSLVVYCGFHPNALPRNIH
jgi:hypothetical protein